jgi:hypothetical protein
MMEDLAVRLYDAVMSRLHGPLKFRFILQPLLAAIFAARAGRADARNGRPAFFWSVLTNPVGRTELLKDGWKDIAKIFVMASIIDIVYQFIAIRQFHPLRAMLVAAVLCFVPYVLIRGPVSRLTRRTGA